MKKLFTLLAMLCVMPSNASAQEYCNYQGRNAEMVLAVGRERIVFTVDLVNPKYAPGAWYFTFWHSEGASNYKKDIIKVVTKRYVSNRKTIVVSIVTPTFLKRVVGVRFTHPFPPSIATPERRGLKGDLWCNDVNVGD